MAAWSAELVWVAPAGRQRLVVLKAETGDPGLYGWGCADRGLLGSR
jgi:hypothetical protein